MSFFFDGGFGDPLDPVPEVPAEVPAELGFGDKEDLENKPPGFGDKEKPAIQSPVLVGAVNGHALYHDEGGEIVRVFADFKKEATLENYESFKVRLRGPNGQASLTPSAGFCYGGVQGKGSTLTPTAANTIIEFSLPPLHLGAYEILIYSPDGADVIWTVSDLLLIERRKRDRSTYRTRNRLHQIYLTGPRRLRQEGDYPST